MARAEINGRWYATAEDISPEQAERAKILVRQMEMIINEDFHKPAEDSRIGEFRMMRKELEDMGFRVEINYEVNLETGEVMGTVVISVVRLVDKSSTN